MTKRVFKGRGSVSVNFTLDRQVSGGASYYTAANNYVMSYSGVTMQTNTTGQAVIVAGSTSAADRGVQLAIYKVIGWE